MSMWNLNTLRWRWMYSPYIVIVKNSRRGEYLSICKAQTSQWKIKAQLDKIISVVLLNNSTPCLIDRVVLLSFRRILIPWERPHMDGIFHKQTQCHIGYFVEQFIPSVFPASHKSGGFPPHSLPAILFLSSISLPSALFPPVTH